MHGDLTYKIETIFAGRYDPPTNKLLKGYTTVFIKHGSGKQMRDAYREQLKRLRDWGKLCHHLGRKPERPLYIKTYVLEEDAGAGGMWIPRSVVGVAGIEYSFKPTQLLKAE